MENSTTIAVDLAKAFFQVSVSTVPGRVAERMRLTRAKFVSFLVTRPPAEIVMEACGSAHFWARTARDFGHRPVPRMNPGASLEGLVEGRQQSGQVLLRAVAALVLLAGVHPDSSGFW